MIHRNIEKNIKSAVIFFNFLTLRAKVLYFFSTHMIDYHNIIEQEIKFLDFHLLHLAHLNLDSKLELDRVPRIRATLKKCKLSRETFPSGNLGH